MPLKDMSFFERFESDILAGKKTITIRDEQEKDYLPGTIVEVSTFEEGRWFCKLKIESVEPISFDNLTDVHAEQENMTLPQLKSVIKDIYPGIKQLYVVSFQLIK